MPCNHRKDLTDLVAKCRLRFHYQNNERHFAWIYLWRTFDSFRAATFETDHAVCACVPMMPYWETFVDGVWKVRRLPKICEAHFITGHWSTEIVAHESQHILWALLRASGASITDIMEQNADAEEDICYVAGTLVDHIYRFLWKHDPCSKWVKK